MKSSCIFEGIGGIDGANDGSGAHTKLNSLEGMHAPVRVPCLLPVALK